MKIKMQLIATLGSLLCYVATGAGQHCQNLPFTNIDPCDEVWLISAREVHSHDCTSVDQLKFERYIAGHWYDGLLHEIQADGESKHNLVYVHGYQTDLKNARERGLAVYQNLLGCGRNVGPVRFIIWAWKSEKELRRPIADFNIKSQRAVELGDIFAMTLNELGQSTTTVVGYSLGAQVVVSAMAQSKCYTGSPVQIAIIAAASDCGFASCCDQLTTCGNVKKSIVFFNQKDRAIRAAKFVCRTKYGTSFLPFQELAIQNTNAFGRVVIVDISNEASRRHAVVRYTALPVVQSFVQQLLLENEILNDSVADHDVAEYTKN